MSQDNSEFGASQSDFNARLSRISNQESTEIDALSHTRKTRVRDLDAASENWPKYALIGFLAVAALLVLFVIRPILIEGNREGTALSENKSSITGQIKKLSTGLLETASEAQIDTDLAPRVYLPSAPAGWIDIKGSDYRSSLRFEQKQSQWQEMRIDAESNLVDLPRFQRFVKSAESSRQNFNFEASSFLAKASGETTLVRIEFTPSSLAGNPKLTPRVSGNKAALEVGPLYFKVDGERAKGVIDLYSQVNKSVQVYVTSNAEVEEIVTILKTIDLEKLKSVHVP